MRRMWKPVVRQVCVKAGTTPAELASVVRPHLDAGRTVLLDSYDKDTPGGSGVAFDWAAAEGVASLERVLLAGGLTPGNVRTAVGRLHPWGVDVASGVETDGVKDDAKVRAFIAAAKGAAAGQEA
jgi:phosphoribosylanthranilate isomerase